MGWNGMNWSEEEWNFHHHHSLSLPLTHPTWWHTWRRMKGSEMEWDGVNPSEVEWNGVMESETEWWWWNCYRMKRSEMEWKLMADQLPSIFTPFHSSSLLFTPDYSVPSTSCGLNFMNFHFSSLQFIPVHSISLPYLNQVEWNRVKWSEVEWSGVKWSEEEWDRMWVPQTPCPCVIWPFLSRKPLQIQGIPSYERQQKLTWFQWILATKFKLIFFSVIYIMHDYH